MNLLLDGESSRRLYFRRLSLSDFDAWLPFHEHPTSTRYWKTAPTRPKIACQVWFDKVFYRYENHLGGMNALIDKKSGVFIGQCGLLVQTVDDTEELEIGYSILPQYHRKGYASEAAQKCKAFAFENELSPSLISIIHVDNTPSIKVALYTGMYLDKKTIYQNNSVAIYRTNKN